MTQNPYQVLGVPNGADLAECTQAYKRLAKKYHPDLNPGDRVAEAKMAEVNAAFDAIKNGNTADSAFTGSRRNADTGSDYYTAVVNFINHGQYAQAINLLGNMDKSDTRWYYLAALAYMGYGDQEKAMANIRIAVNREPNNANYQSAYNSIRQGINPMGFGFDPFSFFDFSAYTAGAGNTGTHRQQRRPARRQGGCLLTILRIALAIFIIRLVILGITSLVSWSTQYQHYDVSPGNAYSYSQSADGNQSNNQNDDQSNDQSENGQYGYSNGQNGNSAFGQAHDSAAGA